MIKRIDPRREIIFEFISHPPRNILNRSYSFSDGVSFGEGRIIRTTDEFGQRIVDKLL